MKRVVFALIFSLLPAFVVAQTIHGHPQKASYASPAEWPVVSSQCHWTPKGAPVILGSMASSHIHVDPQFPIYSENTGEKISGTLTIKAFHFDGVISGTIVGELIDSYTWDETGSATPPADLHGDPAGLKVWTLHVTIDPLKPGAVWQFGPHGWQWARIMVVAGFADGARIFDNQWLPFWSNIDPTQPERLVRGGAGPIMETECDVFSPSNSPQFGNNITEYDDYVPLAPITKAWTVPVSYYSYQADPMPTGTIDQIRDMDFHHGILGVSTMHQDGLVGPHGGMFVPTTFDPAVLGTGTHNVMEGWTQPNPATGEQMSALSVLSITVGDVVTPPPPPPPPTPLTVSCTGVGSGFLQIKADGTFSLTNTSGATTCVKQ